MSRNPERNDRKSGKKPAFGDKSTARPGGRAGSKGPSQDGPDRGGWNPNPKAKAFSDSAPRPSRAKADADNFVWGRHPVLAALANPARKGMGRLLATADRAAELERDKLAHGHRIEIIEVQALDRMLPPGAVHQGLAFKVQPLEGVALEDIADAASGVIVMLDQLTDPQNVGAIF
ncbi:MAG: RNA methyltransferase substrate-binding domain-containing protein, partial [Brevundimonas sp.]|nr:RNA methyltransferase substrate-binding domain-containing protein [Brevundimonas sp.]